MPRRLQRPLTLLEMNKWDREVQLFKEQFEGRRGWQLKMANTIGIARSTVCMILRGHSNNPMIRCFTRSLKMHRLLMKYREEVRHPIPELTKVKFNRIQSFV